jgi:hypothetical protein
MIKSFSQYIPLSDSAQEARKVPHPALLLNANQERNDKSPKNARAANTIKATKCKEQMVKK